MDDLFPETIPFTNGQQMVYDAYTASPPTTCSGLTAEYWAGRWMEDDLPPQGSLAWAAYKAGEDYMPRSASDG